MRDRASPRAPTSQYVELDFEGIVDWVAWARRMVGETICSVESSYNVCGRSDDLKDYEVGKS